MEALEGRCGLLICHVMQAIGRAAADDWVGVVVMRSPSSAATTNKVICHVLGANSEASGYQRIELFNERQGLPPSSANPEKVGA